MPKRGFAAQTIAIIVLAANMTSHAMAGNSGRMATGRGPEGVLETLDTDRDGKLSKSEIQKAPKRVQTFLLNRADLDKNRTVTRAEIEQLITRGIGKKKNKTPGKGTSFGRPQSLPWANRIPSRMTGTTSVSWQSRLGQQLNLSRQAFAPTFKR